VSRPYRKEAKNYADECYRHLGMTSPSYLIVQCATREGLSGFCVVGKSKRKGDELTDSECIVHNSQGIGGRYYVFEHHNV